MSPRVPSATLLSALLVLGASGHAQAAFHAWDVAEVYSNADGSIQYIEFTTASNGQHQVGNHDIVATSDGNAITFTIPANLASSATAGRRFLVATPGFASLPGAVAPDYVLPCGPFFDPAASSITINLVGADSLTFTGAQLPTDGVNALVDSTPAAANPTLGSAANSPTNFGNQTGGLNLPLCLRSGECEPCDDGVFCDGAESCAGGACVAGDEPCGPNETCVELTDECLLPPPFDAGVEDAGAPDADADADPGDADPGDADADPSDADPGDADAEPADAEPADAEPSDAEPSDADPGDADAEALDAEDPSSDAGELTPDAGQRAPDASAPPPADASMGASDAGASAPDVVAVGDAGQGDEEGEGGCGCNTSNAEGEAPLLAGLLLLLVGAFGLRRKPLN